MTYIEFKKLITFDSPRKGCTTPFGNGIYHIQIDNHTLTEDEQTETIIHELVHVLQLKDRRLVLDGTSYWWGDTRYSREFIRQAHDTLPWEIEAREIAKLGDKSYFEISGNTIDPTEEMICAYELVSNIIQL